MINVLDYILLHTYPKFSANARQRNQVFFYPPKGTL